MTSLNLDEVRRQFPSLQRETFLDAACMSLAPRRAVEAIQAFLDATAAGGFATTKHVEFDERRAALRPLAARLLNSAEDEIAIVESTTHGLHIAAEAIPLAAGDRVLLSDLEFVQLALPWCQKRDQIGIEIDVVPHRQGAVPIEAIEERLTPRTRVVAISSVQWNDGYRVDLEALGELCRSREVWLVVDAIQQLGALPIDVRRAPVDILVSGGHKWLNAPFGTGLLYLSRDALARMNKPLAGYLSLEPPEGGWGHYFQTPSITPVADYRFVEQARRFEIGGTANYPGAIGLAASLELLLELGIDNAADHILDLTDYLIAGLSDLGVQVVSPLERKVRSSIVTFSVGSAEENVRLMEYLRENRVMVSVRYTSNVGGVRVSCHYYNTTQDIDRLLELVANRPNS